MAANSQDPFYLVQEEVAQTLQGVQAKYEKWRALPRGSPGVRPQQQEMEEECGSLQYMVGEIDKSIDAAERNPQRFRLSQQELSERRRWVLSTRRQVEAVTSGLAAGPTGGSSGGNGLELGSATNRLAAAVKEENDRFITSEGDRQQMLMRRQDDQLEDLSTHVVRIGELGREMGQELQLQGNLLEELDAEVEGTSTRLQAAQKKVEFVLKKAGAKGQLMIIGGLIVVLVVLVVLLIA